MAEELEVVTQGVEESTSSGGDFADQLIDELMPEELDWRRVVTSYPVASLAVAAVGGRAMIEAV